MALGAMQDWPLSLATLVKYGTSVHSGSEVATWTAAGARTTTFNDALFPAGTATALQVTAFVAGS